MFLPGTTTRAYVMAFGLSPPGPYSRLWQSHGCSSCPSRTETKKLHGRSRKSVQSCLESSNSRALSPDLVKRIRTYLDDNPDAANSPSPLSYVALREAGRTDLVEEIMDAGGYIVVSQQLGVRVDASYANYKRPMRADDVPSVFSAREESGSLALGAGLDARLDVDISSLPPRQDISEQFPAAESRKGNLFTGPEPVPSAESLASIGKDVVVVRDEVVQPGERLTLDARMRTGTLLFVAVSAAGFGRASVGVLDERVIATLSSASEALAVAHIFLAFYAAFVLAPGLGRNRTIWGLKVLLSGPLGIASLRQHGPVKEDAQP